MQSFSSFEKIETGLPKLEMVANIETYFAHRPSEASPLSLKKEPLTDHVHLVLESALTLIKVHGLETVVDDLIGSIVSANPYQAVQVESGNLIKELFLSVILFHDFGKLNENFQLEKMEANFAKVKNGIDSQHSILSAYFFLHYHLNKQLQNSWPKPAKLTTEALLFNFANIITRHHSSTLFLKNLDQEDLKLLNQYLNVFGWAEYPDFEDRINKQSKLEEIRIKDASLGSVEFPLYVLLKLNFSLLTAADYQATLSYNYDISLPGADDFGFHGVLDKTKKARCYQSFKDSADYNRKALEDPGAYLKKPIVEYTAQSNENLNHLRSRMLAEVITNLRENSGSNLFYLKAPTGAGKTNISLAVAMELLQQDDRLNKVFYVFPFTTLITQTYQAVKDTLKLSSSDMVELHSKAFRAGKETDDETDAAYGSSWRNHIDYLFCNFPMVLLSHIKFFDVLKGSRKEPNYLLHRMANSVVIIDELQSYSPKFWNHVNYFITNYAKYFNIRFVVMSATLPEIGKLSLADEMPNDQFIDLLKEHEAYFRTPNFGNRVKFSFELMDTEWSKKEQPVMALAEEILTRTEKYAARHAGNVKAIVEFITKKSASAFLEVVQSQESFREYKILLLSGTILEPRRKEIVGWLKNKAWLKEHSKVLLICTQVVEAGVDIDMDIGFKDHALLDSDEQLAGRVNRNAAKGESELYLFKLDKTGVVYRKDQRLEIQRNFAQKEREEILRKKDFNRFYDQVIQYYEADQVKVFSEWKEYVELIKQLSFPEVDKGFMLIEDNTQAVFIPLELEVSSFSEQEINLLLKGSIISEGTEMVSGADVFRAFENICQNKTGDFAFDRESVKSLQSLLSKFTINVYPKVAECLIQQEKAEWSMRYGYIYFETFLSIEPNHFSYDYESGLSEPINFNYDFL